MDYYSLLGVRKNATSDEIKAAYKKLVKEHHPDRGGDSEHFKKINEAYDTLKDADKKAAYDNPQPQYNFSNSDFNRGFEDLFSQMFGDIRSPSMKNRDLRLTVTIELEDVLTGRDLYANYNLLNGQQTSANIKIHPGVEDGEMIKFKGLGDNSIQRLPRGDLIIVVRIKQHKKFERDRKHLRVMHQISVFDLMLGSKIEVETLSKNTISVNVPKGTQPGTILSVSGHGLPCYKTGSTGNLYIVLKGIIPKVEDLNLIERIKDLNDAINKVS